MAGFVQIKGEVLDYDPRVEALSDKAYRLFMMSFYSGRRTMLGLTRWVPGEVVVRVQGWQMTDVEEALSEVLEAGLLRHDPEARILFNPYVLEFTEPSNPSQLRGAATVLRELPDSPLLIPAMEIVYNAVNKAIRKEERKDMVDVKREISGRLAILIEAFVNV